MIDRYLTKRPNSSYWQLRIPVPKDVQRFVHKREITRSLREADRDRAAQKALPIIVSLREEWRHLLENGCGKNPAAPSEGEMLAIAQDIYEQSYDSSRNLRKRKHSENPDGYEAWLEQEERHQTARGFEVETGQLQRWEVPAKRVLEKRGFHPLGDESWFREFVSMVAEVTIAAVQASNRRDRGDLNPSPNSQVLERAKELADRELGVGQDMPFDELVNAFMKQWRASADAKHGSNTEQQKRATFRLFGEFFENQPIRKVRSENAALFRDAIKLFDPHWARSPSLRSLPWDELVERVGNRSKGLSASTMNRHMRALQELWNWAKQRGHCEGDNPFSNFSVRLKPGVNSHGFLPWEMDELHKLLNPPPARDDLLEIMIVGMFTGMRIGEIAGLTWSDIRTEVDELGELAYFHIGDAKTLSGKRQVPIHSSLKWLLDRVACGKEGRIWPNLNEEGPGKAAGADASRLFSEFKMRRGFADRQKAFHSFRKNVTKMMERARVPENEWAQIIGHEHGFTYSVYNPHGIAMRRKAEVIEYISYGDLQIPFPSPS